MIPKAPANCSTTMQSCIHLHSSLRRDIPSSWAPYTISAPLRTTIPDLPLRSQRRLRRRSSLKCQRYLTPGTKDLGTEKRKLYASTRNSVAGCQCTARKSACSHIHGRHRPHGGKHQHHADESHPHARHAVQPLPPSPKRVGTRDELDARGVDDTR